MQKHNHLIAKGQPGFLVPLLPDGSRVLVDESGAEVVAQTIIPQGAAPGWKIYDNPDQTPLFNDDF